MVHSSESWLPVVGWEDFYEVSDQGGVRSVDRVVIRIDGKVKRFRGQTLTPQPDGKGYLQVTLSRNSNRRTYKIHKLLLDAFVGPCPVGQEGCHGNDVADDNRLENLRWDYHDANAQDMVVNGHHYNANKTHCKHQHEYTAANTEIVIRRTGRSARRCRICKKQEYLVYRDRKRASA